FGAICQPGLRGDRRHVSEGVPGDLDGPTGWPKNARLGRVVVGGDRQRGPRRPGPRRRADGGCDQGLGRDPRVGRTVMSGGIEAEDLLTESRALAERARVAARALAVARGAAKDAWLMRSADEVRRGSGAILEANARDVESAPGYGLGAATIDRLTLNPKRIE